MKLLRLTHISFLSLFLIRYITLTHIPMLNNFTLFVFLVFITYASEKYSTDVTIMSMNIPTLNSVEGPQHKPRYTKILNHLQPLI